MEATMSDLERFGVSMEGDLLKKFDKHISKKGYKTRSEAIRDLIRKQLVQEEWADPQADVVGTVTLVYPHHEHRLSDTLTDLQHRFHEAIVTSTHVHLDPDNCLEVVIVRGKSKRVRKISDALLSTKGVKHGGVVASTGGKHVK
jgi:CopG family transcriptional regulator, nickel-responsive regulator